MSSTALRKVIAALLVIFLVLPLIFTILIMIAINSFGFVNNTLDPASRWWLTGAVYIAAAALVSTSRA